MSAITHVVALAVVLLWLVILALSVNVFKRSEKSSAFTKSSV